jgi:hypothetical protein
LRDSTYDNPFPYPKFREDLMTTFQISKDIMESQLDDLETVDYISDSEIWINDLASYYITSRGLELLENDLK